MADLIGPRVATMKRDADLLAQGFHRVRRKSSDTGKVETVWCGIDSPCTCQSRVGPKVSRWRTGA